jgi:hypothetical protein
VSDVTKAAPGTLHPYYSYDKIMSYNAVFNIISGARGLGKTYGAKLKAVKAAIKSWHDGDMEQTAVDQFIYMRRYKDEKNKSKASFFNDMSEEKALAGYDFRVDGDYAQMSLVEFRGEKKRQWITIGFFIALSVSAALRSVSFHQTKTIIYDEFIKAKGPTQYLANEPIALLEFFNTVDRNKDKTRVFMLSNAVSIENPFFIEWGIVPDQSRELNRYFVDEDGLAFIAVHFPEAELFQTSVYKTRFGKFIKGTEYADYAVGNTFVDNHDHLIMLKDQRAVYQYTLETKSGSYSIWSNDVEGVYYAQRKLPKQQRLYTMIEENMTSEKIMLWHSDKLMQMLRSAFKHGLLYFDDPRTRNGMLAIFKR